MEKLFDNLYPICRSITGEGLRESLYILSNYIPLEIIRFKTGEKVLNWEIPQEWIIRDAWIKDKCGKKVLDFKDSNLHIVNYSSAINKKMTLEELTPHINTKPNLPNAIPYVISYYKKRWGFCMEHSKFNVLEDGMYHAFIDSEFIDGELNLGHVLLKGESEKEILISSYLCHPSMANNELSGPIVLAFLYNRILKWEKRHFTYRFVINPETIGCIAYLSRFGDELIKNMYSGIILTCLGGDMSVSYKKSRRGDSPIDQLATHIFNRDTIKGSIREFTPTNGSDERQYCSPGFNLPVGQFAKLVYGSYKEYHTSLDNKELMGIENLQKSLNDIELILKTNEYNGYYINLYPFGEIKLDQYSLYPNMNGPSTSRYSNNSKMDGRQELNYILMILNYSDGEHTLLDIAKKCNCSIIDLIDIIEKLKQKGVIEGPYFEKRSIVR
ncbi:MAG: DUF4910 domain-containing protein [Gottschalkiaceae bacterium]|nr:MAG: DUF4910 domain-containing protein [Gottschalkiaceae bacterium]